MVVLATISLACGICAQASRAVLGGSRGTQAPSPARPRSVKQCTWLWGGEQGRETPPVVAGTCLELACPTSEPLFQVLPGT